MDEKCEKYEALFIFGSENELEKHIQECETCHQEHLNMQKTATILKEVKPYILQNKKSRIVSLQKTAAGIFIIGLTCFAISNFSTNSYTELSSLNYSEDQTSVIKDMGLPTDDYGLLMME
jgi:hypothetical protein